MAKFSFKCPQCGEMVDADDSFRGQVAECPYCSKGIVVPRSIMVKPTSSQLPPANGNVAPTSQPIQNHATQTNGFERKLAWEAERRRQKQRHEKTLRLITVVMIIVFLAGGLIWWNKIKMNELALQRARLAAERAEADRKERIAREEKERVTREEKEKQDAAVTAFHSYLAREVMRLKESIEETKIACNSIDIDQKELSEELARIEKENARLVALFKKQGRKRYDKAEHVLLVLKSNVLGRLSEKYCGEDLTAIRTKYESEVNAILKIHHESSKRLRENKEKYYAAVKGIDEEVAKKNNSAHSKILAASNEADANLRNLMKKRARLTKEEDSIRRGLQGPRTRKRLAEIRIQVDELDRMISMAQVIVSGSKAQESHIDATKTESSARKKFDTALEIRQSNDNDVHSDMQHESNIFHLAERYEQMTLDKLRTAMRSNSELQLAKAAESQKKLEYITRSTVNLDLMKPNEIEDLRRKIVFRLSEGITGYESAIQPPND